MKITVKKSNNFDKTIESYIERLKRLKYIEDIKTLILTSVANAMVNDMKMLLSGNIPEWSYPMPDGNDSSYQPSANEIQLKSVSNGVATITVGDNAPLIQMSKKGKYTPNSDGAMVNPFFFIEFGFGLKGEANPIDNITSYDWEYNINNHTNDKAQFSWKINGAVGVGFIQHTIRDYSTRWIDIAVLELKKAGIL